MSSPVLTGSGLERRFASGRGMLEVLTGADVEVQAGEIVAVVGPSGSGKSTLLHCLGGLDRPDAGTVRVEGDDVWQMSERDLARLRNRKIGFVYQFHHLLPDFTALENVLLPRLMSGESHEAAADAARRLLEWVGLGDRMTHSPGELSGGEQQRVAVARALVNQPSVVLADEPSGNLDLVSSRSLHELLHRMRDEQGATFLIATHDPGLAATADRVLRMEAGRLMEADRDDPKTWIPSVAVTP
ncbi:MAG: lipoprotein-releasing system ATP-binding protein LolD [Gemmatimonadota bacterium]|nr:MAG: lipoprotein-releasing system ATP-binding protein LolD [Gemmatimonadota bacterium]